MFNLRSQYDSVAQLVEQLTLNQWVESSNLSGVTYSFGDDNWLICCLCMRCAKAFRILINKSIHHQESTDGFRGVSSAGLEHYLDRVGVIGSNPIHPTLHTFKSI